MTSVESDGEIASILKSSKTIAIVGMSEKTHRASNGVAKYLIAHGYDVIPVNPNYTSVLGLKCYPSLLDVPHKIDIVDCFRRSEEIVPIAHDAIKVGAKALWMQLGIVNEQAARAAATAGLSVIMDRCIKIEHARLVR